MLLLITTALFLCLTAACAKPTAKEDTAHAAATPVFQPPTATEVFNLRSRCADLADKIRDDNIIGSALTQEAVSHYDQKTGRCYVELDVHMANLAQYEDYYASYVFDGQTKELLVNVSSKKGDKRAFIKDGELNLLDYGKALERMAILMADDRNPAVSSTH